MFKKIKAILELEERVAKLEKEIANNQRLAEADEIRQERIMQDLKAIQDFSLVDVKRAIKGE